MYWIFNDLQSYVNNSKPNSFIYFCYKIIAYLYYYVVILIYLNHYSIALNAMIFINLFADLN